MGIPCLKRPDCCPTVTPPIECWAPGVSPSGDPSRFPQCVTATLGGLEAQPDCQTGTEGDICQAVRFANRDWCLVPDPTPHAETDTTIDTVAGPLLVTPGGYCAWIAACNAAHPFVLCLPGFFFLRVTLQPTVGADAGKWILTAQFVASPVASPITPAYAEINAFFQAVLPAPPEFGQTYSLPLWTTAGDLRAVFATGDCTVTFHNVDFCPPSTACLYPPGCAGFYQPELETPDEYLLTLPAVSDKPGHACCNLAGSYVLRRCDLLPAGDDLWGCHHPDFPALDCCTWAHHEADAGGYLSIWLTFGGPSAPIDSATLHVTRTCLSGADGASYLFTGDHFTGGPQLKAGCFVDRVDGRQGFSLALFDDSANIDQFCDTSSGVSAGLAPGANGTRF